MEIELGISQTALAAIGLLFGLLFGSFLNVVILRLPVQLKGDWRRDSRDFLGLEPEPWLYSARFFLSAFSTTGSVKS